MSTGVRPRQRFTVGRSEDATHPDTIRAAISEFIATAIFVFAAEGSVLSLGTYQSIALPIDLLHTRLMMMLATCKLQGRCTRT